MSSLQRTARNHELLSRVDILSELVCVTSIVFPAHPQAVFPVMKLLYRRGDADHDLAPGHGSEGPAGRGAAAGRVNRRLAGGTFRP